VTYNAQAVDVSETVGRILRSMKGAISEAQAEVTAAPLPRAWGDPTAIEQIFTNLVGNALAYRDPSRPARVEIGGETRNGRSCYFVKDNGLGIPEAAVTHLFTAFRRFHPHSGPGEGIGLAMVRRMVERHGGSIRVESSPGSGSTFFLEFPNAERHA
jgi:signal transduction histidine kinase